MKNIDMFQNCAYHEQHAFDPMTANHHYELLSSDFSSLYHKHNQQNGINIEFAPELVLLKLWLGASLEPELSSAGAELSQVLHMVLSIYNFGHRAG